jgi:acylphosphatase
MEKDHKQAHLFIEGRVQGVGFRHFTTVNARELGVNGWVRNLSDGRVEAVFEGSEAQVKNLIDRCRSGPRSAKVSDITVSWQEETSDFNSFETRY